MPTRRKYKQPKTYRDGGRVVSEDIAVPDDLGSGAVTQTRGSEAADDDALTRALQGQQRADELQRQAARQPTEHERFVDGLPGLSDRKRAFLKSNPALVRNDVAPIAGAAYQEALRAGIPDDTDQIEQYVIERT